MFSEFSRKPFDDSKNFSSLGQSPDQYCEPMIALIRHYVESMQFVEAEKVAKRLVERVEADCGITDPLRAAVLVELSRTYELVQEYEKAEDALAKAIVLAESQADSEDWEGMANELRMRKAELMTRLGHHEEVIALSSEVLDDQNASVAQRVASYISLAQAQAALGLTELYSDHMLKAYSVAQDAPHDEAERLAAVFAGAAKIEDEAGRFEVAAELFCEAGRSLSVSYDENLCYIAQLEMCAADLYDRAGMFEQADNTRAQVLQAVTNKHGKASRLAMDVREDLALGMSSHAGGNFEQAEQMLCENVELAVSQGDPDLLIEKQIALAEAYSARGKYSDAVRILREAHQQLADEHDPEVRIGLLKEFAGCLAELGSGEEAAMLFRQALEESTLIPGPQTVLLQVELLSSLASVIAISDPEEAHSKIKQCHDLLDELPPGYEPVSRLDLRLLSSSVDNATVSSDGRGGKVEARLRDLEQRFGHAFPEERALLMLQKAEALMASWDHDGAQDLLEMAKRVLEERARSHTLVYAMVLSKFIETLLPDDPRVMEYRKQAAAIMEEAERASSYLDHQDEE